MMNYMAALSAANRGILLARKGWRIGTFIGKYFPTKSDFVTEPFLYVDTTNVVSNTPSTVRGVAPWAASQCDMNAQDWYVFGSPHNEPEYDAVLNTYIDAEIEVQGNNGYTYN